MSQTHLYYEIKYIMKQNKNFIILLFYYKMMINNIFSYKDSEQSLAINVKICTIDNNTNYLY